METAEEIGHTEIGEEDEEEVYHTEDVVNYLWFMIYDFKFVF